MVSFTRLSRGLHWLMAALILAMLAIGIAMVSSLADYRFLVALHRPLGIAILVLAVIRLINRMTHKAPALPRDMPVLLKAVAQGSHWVLYGLMFALPLVGWAMVSAAGNPIVLAGSLHLPPLVGHDVALYAVLRQTHSVLAFGLFAIILAHMSAALAHAFIFRDGVFQTMTAGTVRDAAAERSKSST